MRSRRSERICGSQFGRVIDREIRLSARLPQVRSLQSRDYSRRRLGSHGWPSDEQMATISGRHVHSLYLGVPGSAVGDCDRVGRFAFHNEFCTLLLMLMCSHLCERVEENKFRKKTYEIFFSVRSGATRRIERVEHVNNSRIPRWMWISRSGE